MFLIGGLEGFPALSHFLPDRFQTLRRLLGRGQQLIMLLVGPLGACLQLIRILARVGHL